MMYGVKTWNRAGEADIVVQTPQKVEAERVYNGTAVGGEVKQVELFEDTPAGYYVLAVK